MVGELLAGTSPSFRRRLSARRLPPLTAVVVFAPIRCEVRAVLVGPIFRASIARLFRTCRKFILKGARTMHDTTQYSAASSWVGIFATIWFEREATQVDDDRRAAESQRRRRQWGRRRQETPGGTADNLGDIERNPQESARPHAFTGAWRRPLTASESYPRRAAGNSAQPLEVAGSDDRQLLVSVPVDRSTGSSARVDLFPIPHEPLGSVPDDLAASPVNAPQRLEALTRSLRLRLLALPGPLDLGHRSIAYRGRLVRALTEAELAMDRLTDGSYGLCANCASPISYNTLAGKPWTGRCAHCALDL